MIELYLTLVDNSGGGTSGGSSNPYACEDTEDKLFLISYREGSNSNYGFGQSLYNDSAKILKSTDFSIAAGGGNSNLWWMRSPVATAGTKVSVVNSYGAAGGMLDANSTHVGVAPAMWITVSNEEIFTHTSGDAVKENVVAPTCTTSGSYDSVEYCKWCSLELSRVNVTDPATGHRTAEVGVSENVIHPTCENEGSYDNVFYCTACGIELERTNVTVAAKGHTEAVLEAKAPTCSEEGLTEGSHCSSCGKVFVSQQTIPMLDHTPAAP